MAAAYYYGACFFGMLSLAVAVTGGFLTLDERATLRAYHHAECAAQRAFAEWVGERVLGAGGTA